MYRIIILCFSYLATWLPFLNKPIDWLIDWIITNGASDVATESPQRSQNTLWHSLFWETVYITRQHAGWTAYIRRRQLEMRRAKQLL